MHDTLNAALTPYLMSLIIATGIGLIIGLEREFSETSDKDHFAGIRTYPLVAILGCVVTFLAGATTNLLLAFASAAIVLLLGFGYFIRSQDQARGVLNEIALLIAFFLGSMAALHLIREALAAAVICTTLLSLKGKFRSIIARITQEELFAFIKFIVICMLLFPFLPDAEYGPGELFNPREVGSVVVIVSLFSFVGYLLIRFVGAGRGILLTAFFGGLFSSTAVTWVFSAKSRTSDPSLSPLYAAGIILASSIMFLRVAGVTLIFSSTLFQEVVVPCVLVAAVGGMCTFCLARNTRLSAGDDSLNPGNPISISSALGFGLLYLGISFMVHYGNAYFGNKGLYLSGLLAGLADVDAITVRMAKFAEASPQIALYVILAATLSNTIVKTGMVLVKGNTLLRTRAGFGLGAMIIAGGLFASVRALLR